MSRVSFYFKIQRSLHYLRYLTIFYLKRTATPFLYTAMGYLLYAFLQGVMDWSFPGYGIIHFLVNLLFLIILVNTTMKIFTPLHHSHSALQELAIPVSIEERFLGNYFFYGGVVLSLIYLIHSGGYGIMFLLGRENSTEFTHHLWGDYSGFNLMDFFLIYSYFFAGSIYFKKSPIAKSLLIFILAALISAIFFSLPNFGFDVYVQGERFNLENDLTQTNDSQEQLIDALEKIVYYLFFLGWFLGGYLKLRRSQFQA